MKRLQFQPGAVPQKYRELIGLAISAAARDAHGIFNFTETARAFGAEQAEIEETLHYVKLMQGWMSYIHGITPDFGRFREQVLEALEHYRSRHQR